MAEESNPMHDFTHIGVVVHDLEQAIAKYEALGHGPFNRFDFPNPKFLTFKLLRHYGRDASENVYKVAWGKFGAISMEIFQPISGDSIAQRMLETKGEGVWHYGYDVKSMDETIAYMAARGYSIIGESETEQGVRMCYFDTEDSAGGVLIQAHEVPEESDMYSKLEGKA